jgi:NADH-quinone oxidoreductase subunit J
MKINDFFGSIFSIIIIFTASASVFSKNAVYSAFFLILSFLSSASLLFLYKCEFIPLLFIIVYVGAIAVLFLFVIMMLDLKTKSVEKINIKFLPTGFYMALFFLLSSLINNFQYWFKMRNPYYNSIKYNEYYNWFNKTEVILEIEAIGQVLYNYYVLSFLISGFLLFLAVLGSISLTTNFKTQQNLFESVKQV